MEKERASAHCTRLRHSKEGADQISLHGVLKTLEVGYVLPAPMPPSETRNWYDTMFARIELEIDLEERILMKAKATMVTHTHTHTHTHTCTSFMCTLTCTRAEGKTIILPSVA
jgi:hypothetical protein